MAPVVTLAELAARPIWVAWRHEARDGRTTKVPYDPRTGRRAASDDPATWATHDEAAWWVATQHGAGVGVMFSDIGDTFLAGIDLDSCRDQDAGDIAPWAQEIIDRLDTYAEVSPSGTGVKVFFTVANADAAAIEVLFDGKQGRSFKNGGGDHPPAIEVYRGRRYFTVTNESCGPTDELRRVSLAELEWLVDEAGPRFAGEAKRSNGADTSRSAAAWRAGATLKAGGASYDAMRDALLAHEDSDIADWARTKGFANGERELRRIYDKSPCAAGVIDTRAPYDNARLFQAGLATPLRHHRGGFYEWDGCAWPEAGEAALRARLYAFLDQCQSKTKGGLCPVKPNAMMVGGVLDALRAAAHLDVSITPPAWLDDADGPPAHEVVACANGLLHLPTLRLLPHTPSFFILNALDYPYERDALEPRRWLAFLSQLWPGDPEAIATLQQIFGYCLTNDTSQQKAFLLVGPKRSGKGTIGRVLTRLVGAHNCTAPTLASLGANFGLAPLIGKNLAIISDARLSGRADQHVIAESLLAITGEDTRTIDRKYNPQAWTGRLPTRFLILTNELPKLADVSGALASRFILLLLTESFYGHEDRGLTNRLLTELPGIFNWALAGWAALSHAGRFEQPASSQEAVDQLEDLTSPIGAFVRECCKIGAAYSATVDDVFAAWEAWCEAQRREHTGTVQSFARDLRATVPGLKMARPREGGGRVRVYQGLRLTPK